MFGKYLTGYIGMIIVLIGIVMAIYGLAPLDEARAQRVMIPMQMRLPGGFSQPKMVWQVTGLRACLRIEKATYGLPPMTV